MKELAKFFIFTLPLIAIFWLASLPIYLMVIVIILFAIIGIVWICKYIEEKKKKEEEDRKKYERFFEKKMMKNKKEFKRFLFLLELKWI